MKLSSREKLLAGVVLGAVFVVFNLVLFKTLAHRQNLLREQLAARAHELKETQVLLAERDLWAKRDEWLTAKQPKLENESSAGVQLLNQISELARKHSVTLENKTFASATHGQWFRSVAVVLETKSSWRALIEFLHVVQGPDRFIVFESAEIAIDPGDATQMRGKFRIARWYAP